MSLLPWMDVGSLGLKHPGNIMTYISKEEWRVMSCKTNCWLHLKEQRENKVSVSPDISCYCFNFWPVSISIFSVAKEILSMFICLSVSGIKLGGGVGRGPRKNPLTPWENLGADRGQIQDIFSPHMGSFSRFSSISEKLIHSVRMIKCFNASLIWYKCFLWLL